MSDQKEVGWGEFFEKAPHPIHLMATAFNSDTAEHVKKEHGEKGPITTVYQACALHYQAHKILVEKENSVT